MAAPARIGGAGRFWRQPMNCRGRLIMILTRRAAEAGKRFAFLPSLGVLKFHSQVWKFYAREGEPPQERWLQKF